ncbi:MAG: hypothetical protein IMW92_10385 [Bacillales bacterium]|nr:hypothetical protein [Bacillales bacterium]
MFERHPIPYQIDDKESILHIGPIHLSWDEMLLWGVGLGLSYLLMISTPSLGSHIIFSHIHQFIPFYIALIIAHVKYGGMSIRRYMIYYLRQRFRTRVYTPRQTIEEEVL